MQRSPWHSITVSVISKFVRLVPVRNSLNMFPCRWNEFKLFRTGTSLTNFEITDTVMLCQGERCVLEFSFKYPGRFMFHAHQSEFAELGWMGMFDVQARPQKA